MNKNIIKIGGGIFVIILIVIGIFLFLNSSENGNDNNENKINDINIEQNNTEKDNKDDLDLNLEKPKPKEISEEEKKERLKAKNFDDVISKVKDYAANHKQFSFNKLDKLPFIKNIRDTEDGKIIELDYGVELREGDYGFYDMYGIGYINGLFIVKNPTDELKAKNNNSDYVENMFSGIHTINDIYKIIPYFESDNNGLIESKSYVIIEYNDGIKDKYFLNELKIAGYKYDTKRNKIYKEKIVEDGKIHHINQEYIIFNDKAKKEYKGLLKKEFKNGKKFIKINPLKLAKYDDKYFILDFDFPAKNLYIINKARKKAYLIEDNFHKGDKVKINIKLLAKILDIKNKDKIEMFFYAPKDGCINKFGKDIIENLKTKYVLNIGN